MNFLLALGDCIVLIKEKVLNVLKNGIYSDLIKYKTREELEEDIKNCLKKLKISYEDEEIFNLSKTVLTEGQCVIKGINIRNINYLKLVNYDSEIKSELKYTDLSSVNECYKKRMLDILSNRVYKDYNRQEVSVKFDNKENLLVLLDDKIEELSKDNRNIVKFAKSTLRIEDKNDKKVFFTVFTKK